jgi:hypothetical protein
MNNKLCKQNHHLICIQKLYLLRIEMLLLFLSFVVLFLPIENFGQDAKPLLEFGVTGSGNSQYSATIGKIEVQKLLLDIAKEPRNANFVNSALQDSEISLKDLEELGLIRNEKAKYVLNFMLLSNEDQRKIYSVSEKYASSLAAEFLKRKPEIEAILKDYKSPTIDAKDVNYIVLGCFSLDWDGLDLTAEKDYRITADTISKGKTYIPWANQIEENQLNEAMFKGSHNSYLSSVVITSFGDHYSLPRHALPDAFFQATVSRNMPASLRRKFFSVMGLSFNNTISDIGKIMFALRQGEKNINQLAEISGLSVANTETLVALLNELEYVGQKGGMYHAKIPVLVEQDKMVVQKLRQIGRDVMSKWLEKNYDKTKSDLRQITYLQYGGDYKIAFTEIWHYIFGLTNKKLVEAGFFSDPYSKDRKYKGFIPAVWHPSLSDFR